MKKIGDHPLEDLAKSGYIITHTYEVQKNLIKFL
jgi:hypothetical protein